MKTCKRSLIQLLEELDHMMLVTGNVTPTFEMILVRNNKIHVSIWSPVVKLSRLGMIEIL
jgi:hypothetical protein